MTENLRAAYRTVLRDHFPSRMTLRFEDEHGVQTLVYEKVTWDVGGERAGLRYGENPGQEAALYRLVNGNLTLGDVTTIQPGRYLVSDVELLQSGKHPGKINLTDVDSALNILRHLTETPCTVIVKHNNPCGVAKAATLAESYRRADLADRVAAFGGAIAVNREMDVETARLISEHYAEVVAAPEYAPGAMGLLARRKDLRVMRIRNMERLQTYAHAVYLDFRSLLDGGIIAQASFVPKARSAADFFPASAVHDGREVRIARLPTPDESDDLFFGWMIETGVTSNSVLYVKDGVTVGIGTGEQDRVGVAEIARDKAYRKMADRLSWERYRIPYRDLRDEGRKREIDEEVRAQNGGLKGARMVSDAFFPFRDAVDVAIAEGITAIVQPGGSLRDHESIEACNEAGVAMVFTGQRCFRH